MENRKKGEFLSRRNFFKKAAKAALPVIGAIVLANAPNIIKAAEKVHMECTECNNYCIGCKYNCENTCKNACKETCKNISR